MTYLTAVNGVKPGFMQIYRHFYYFACVALDRIFFLTGKHAAFDVTVNNAEVLHQYLDSGRACLLLGGHMGSFEVLRVLGGVKGLDISILMYEENAKQIKSVISMLNPELAQKVVAIGQPQTLLKVKELADDGELIGILGDRLKQGDKFSQCTFLGRSARFPTGAMTLALALDIPVVFGAALYRGGNRYEIFFEELKIPAQVQRRERMDVVNRLTCEYVSRLEFYCKRDPYNWFNFYDIWADAD